MATITNTTRYTNFASINNYEELSIAVARKILDFQQNAELNPNALEVITINTNENTDRITISMTVNGRFKADGTVAIRNYFPAAEFIPANGTYPFVGDNILEAYFYLVAYQHSLEINSAKNPNAENQFCAFTIESTDVVGEPWPLSVLVEQNEAPLLITGDSERSISQGNIYLL